MKKDIVSEVSGLYNICKCLCCQLERTQVYKSINHKINKVLENNTITVGDFTLTDMDRTTTQKINKETMTLNDTLGWWP